MCYNVKALKKTQLKRARLHGSAKDVSEILDDLEKLFPEEFHLVSGFAHPNLIIYISDNPFTPKLSTWGLIPSWVKDEEQKIKIWNNTINARGETIFEKPSFKESAISKRCIIPIDGFYEHHHKAGKTYPYYVTRIDREPMHLAGLYSEWMNQSNGKALNTCTIVTTTGNELMREIHNSPKLKEARMPVILNDIEEDNWLKPISSEREKKAIAELIRPMDNEKLKAHTVRKLSGKSSLGNVSEASNEYVYEALNFPTDLFS